MNFPNRTRAIFAVFGAQLVWGLAGPLVKIVLGEVPPFGLMFLRFLFATVALFIIYELRFSQKPPVMTATDKRNIFLAGFFGVFVNIALYFWAQRLTTVIDAWVITSTGTLFVIGYCFLFLKEKLSTTVYFGAALAFVGTLVIIGTPIFDIGSGSLLGNILMLASTLAGVISYLITKKLVAKFPPLVLTYYFFLISLFFSLPLFLWEYLQNPVWLNTISPQSWGIIAYLVFGSSIAAYTLQFQGLKNLSASIAATLGYASTVISVALSILFLHEQPTGFFIIGSVLVAIGLFLAESRHSSHPIHKLGRK